MKQILRNSIIITFVSFVLQLSWEYWQCGIFYAMDKIGSTQHLLLMSSATFGDVVMTIILYGLLCIVNNTGSWIIAKWEIKEYVIMLLYALFLSFYFEVSALYTGRWAYSELMPLFPNTNIGLIPVIQLVILFPVTFYISKVIFRKFVIKIK